MQGLPVGRVRVLCVDDNSDVAAVIGRCVALEPDMESAGSLPCADNVVAVVRETRADIVLMDMFMPGKDPLVAVRELVAAHPPFCGAPPDPGVFRPVRVILFSGCDDAAVVDSAVDAGACGCLSKSASIAVILGAIRSVASGAAAFGVWR